MESLEEWQVGRMNAMLQVYMGHLGVSEEAKREFGSKACAMKSVGAFNSDWFHETIVRLLHILGEIRQCQVGNPNTLQIDLNQPPPSVAMGEVERQVTVILSDTDNN